MFSSTLKKTLQPVYSLSNLNNKYSVVRPMISTTATGNRPGFFPPQVQSQFKKQNNRMTFTTTSIMSQSPYDNIETEKLESFLQEATSVDDFFASKELFPTFESIGLKSPILLERVKTMLGNNDESSSSEAPQPSAVQAAAYTAILSDKDVTIGAETGSGKTLAYLLPLIDDILQSKEEKLEKEDQLDYEYARAVILVPNKELASQVMRMAIPLCGGDKCVIWGPSGESAQPFGSNDNLGSTSATEKDTIRIGLLPGGLKSPEDYKPFRLTMNDPINNPPLDLVICTPASLGPWGLNPKNIELFADIQTLVIDEADMLFDGGYLRPLENTLLGFKRADRLDASLNVKKTQHVLVAATLPDMGLKSVEAYVQKKFPYATRVTMKGMHNARHYGLGEKTFWVEDDYDDLTPKKTRMEKLVSMMKASPGGEDEEGSGLAGEKVMLFLNSVDDVDSATNALRRSGVEAVPFHGKIPLSERTQNLNRFRKFVAGEVVNDDDEDNDSVPVLVCTDLAARGLDIPGVTAVVQMQFAGNVVTHLHRMGRCGRAGNRNGRGVIFYGGVESDLVKVVREAELQQDTMVLKGNDLEDDQDKSNEEVDAGKVRSAFSRKRGFTKKRKKIARKAREGQNDDTTTYY